MRFEVHQSHRLENLLGALARRLADDPLPPLEWETILVPAQGLARWVQLRLAERFGIVAGLKLPFFGAFLQQLCQKAAGENDDPFAREVMVWRIWRLLGSAVHRDELGPAVDYCRDDRDGTKRFQLASRLAACFDDYQLWRDDVLLAFARGDDGKAHGPHGPWQANLWRALLLDAGITAPGAARPRRKRGEPAKESTPSLFGEIGAGPPPSQGSAHRLDRLRELLADPERARTVLPKRLSVFGAGTLPPAFLQLLQRIAAIVPVDLYAPSPTPHFVGDLRERGDHAGDNALLARLGTEAREFADLLAKIEDDSPEGSVRLARADEAAQDDDTSRPASLLACVQRDIVDVRDRAGAERFRLRADDDSLRVHDCHSPQRELEVVRDQILAAFDADPTLQPHDVLVLVPDIDRYAPYAHAVFEPVADHLPFRVADRSPARELPICKALLEVLQLARSRLVAFDVLHLLEEPAIRRCFGLFATDLPALRSMCQRASIRWGLDGASRQALHDIPAFEENSWRQGLDRMVLGAATGPADELFDGVLPAADVTESRLPLLLRFVAFTDTLFAKLAPLRDSHSLVDWARLLDELITTLFTAEGPDDDAAIAHLHEVTAELRRLAAIGRHTEPVSAVVLRDWLLAALRKSVGSRGYLAGAVTVAAMLPMRTVPARCVFVCGLDDASFPRRDTPAPFDLIAAKRRAGDRSRRLDDRQMFLDVLLAARDKLHLTFVGHSAKDDAPCAPSVVLSELMEHLDRACVPADENRTVRDLVVVRQPLQPWSRRYRTNDDLRLFTFSGRASAALRPTPERPWCAAPVTTATEAAEPISFAQLRDFWWNPSRWFLRNTMKVRLPRDDGREDEDEPFGLDTLDKYRLQHAALERAQRGDPPLAEALQHARATGVLPVGMHGAIVFAQLDAETRSFVDEAMRHHASGRRHVVVTHADFTIAGEIEGVGANELVFVRPASMKPKDKLRGWLSHLVATVARHRGAPDMPSRTRIIGKDETRLIEPLELDEALRFLADLVRGFRTGSRSPLPFFEHSSNAYGAALHDSDDETAALAKAKKKWTVPDDADYPSQYDEFDADVQLCVRGRDPFDAQFKAWAKCVWQPAVSYLRLTERRT